MTRANPSMTDRAEGLLLGCAVGGHAQLTAKLMEALADAQGFDLTAVADRYMQAYRESTAGWGRSTLRSVERMMAGSPPTHSGERNGTGNSVLRRMAPLVLAHVAWKSAPDERIVDTEKLTLMTHDSVVALVASQVFGEILFLLFSEQALQGAALLERALHATIQWERHYGERLHELSGCLRILLRSGHGLQHDATVGAAANMGTCHATASLALCLGILAHQQDVAAVLRAGTLRDETEHNATILGSTVGGIHGTALFPQELLQTLPDLLSLRAIAQRFSDVLSS